MQSGRTFLIKSFCLNYSEVANSGGKSLGSQFLLLCCAILAPSDTSLSGQLASTFMFFYPSFLTTAIHIRPGRVPDAKLNITMCQKL